MGKTSDFSFLDPKKAVQEIVATQAGGKSLEKGSWLDYLGGYDGLQDNLKKIYDFNDDDKIRSIIDAYNKNRSIYEKTGKYASAQAADEDLNELIGYIDRNQKNVILPKVDKSSLKSARKTSMPSEYFDETKKELHKMFQGSDEWIEPYGLENLISIKGEDEAGKKFLKQMASTKSDEPYTGDLHMAIWNTTPNLHDLGLNQPIPRQVENLKGVLGKEVPKGGSDPFMWMDTRYGVTRKLLEKNKDAPLTINTRSDLIAHDDYMKLLNKSKHKINIHLLGDLDVSRLSSFMEPGAPSIRRRLDAAKKLQEAGFDVTIVKDVLQNKNIPPKLQQMLFKSQPMEGFKVKQNVVNVPDSAVEKMKKILGDFE
jgi:hypothetical protein